LTFHASYNCGSMLQAYALQTFLKKHGYQPEIVDFSSDGQRELYRLYAKNSSLKMFVRNCVLWLHRGQIQRSCERYEAFKRQQFALTDYSTSLSSELVDNYVAVIAGADQIWNVTIADYDDAYFLPWVKHARKIAYAPSFGAKNVARYAANPERIRDWLLDFDYLSIRENNGRVWIRDLTGRDSPVVLDPTLLLSREDYREITSSELKLPPKYIFYYSPGYSLHINRTVRKISKKYGLPVIAFNAKSFHLRAMGLNGFQLPATEDPSTYLQLMEHAEMVITTSFHGTIFASMFFKNFWVIKNGGMFGDDDRVHTLLECMKAEDRLIPEEFDDMFDYMRFPKYSSYVDALSLHRERSQKYLLDALGDVQ